MNNLYMTQHGEVQISDSEYQLLKTADEELSRKGLKGSGVLYERAAMLQSACEKVALYKLANIQVLLCPRAT